LEIDYLRTSARISKFDHIVRKVIIERMKADKNIVRIGKKSFKWFGHVWMMKDGQNYLYTNGNHTAEGNEVEQKDAETKNVVTEIYQRELKIKDVEIHQLWLPDTGRQQGAV
jgi:hypothetical protein